MGSKFRGVPRLSLRWVTGAMLALALGVSPAAAQDSTAALGDADLAPTSAPPWNPPAAISAERPWEMVVGFPFRVATLPLVALGFGVDRTLEAIETTSLVPRLGLALLKLSELGITLAPAGLGDRTGLGGAVGVRPPVFRGWLSADLSGSTNMYTRTRIAAGGGPLRVGYLYDWRPREQFFGTAPASDFEDVRSTYAVRSQSYRVELHAPWRSYPLHQVGKPPRVDPLRFDARVWVGPRESILRRGRENPSIQLVHPGPGALIDRRQEHFVYGIGAEIDTRVGRPHWSQGFRAGVAVERFDQAIESFAIRDAHTDAPTFTRVTYDAVAGVSFLRDPRTIRVGVRVVDQTGAFDPGALLPSDLTTLGGSRGLAGFEPGRFHDVDGIVGKLTYIYPLSRSLEMDLHAEAGTVVPELRRMRRSTFASSYGFAFRPRRSGGVLASVGMDWSEETIRVRYSFGGVE
jgi:hypothetical protein